MNSVIYISNKKKLKYVYDETVVSKPGWLRCQKGDSASNSEVLSGNKDNEDDENVANSTASDRCTYAAARLRVPSWMVGMNLHM
eukprot:scaffold379_cov76-Skeletonema_dohrnii-CCMP3373.AAC.1